ncbi:condensation domain-containing protein [Micromonospora sp. WMMA1363]|uniref:condensation domain-containing protein n=1 Tax=Micromonospora sp. WMMA1363 TaxID=3053985 RepID=UPI00259CFE0B|nr:condensation domain-containing protein [Micromonospora sp. WMMA1363]MDM4719651.1 condensation domain-containing protein [Micromonospora sp. WMMA1363]
MTDPFEAADGSFVVLTNNAGQHSLWPAPLATHPGWDRVYGPASKLRCQRYVDAYGMGDGPLITAELSVNQEFLLRFDRGDTDGAFGERHTLAAAWRITGEIDTTALRAALDAVVARHEILRTLLVADDGGCRQVIHPARSVRLVLRDLTGVAPDDRPVQAEQLLNEVDAEPFPVRDLPHLRAVLGRFDPADAVLVLTTHHTATDAWSMDVLMRDLAATYTAVEPLPPVTQYREFTAWESTSEATAGSERARGYWRQTLAGAAVTGLPTDRPLRAGRPDAYAVQRFVFDTELSSRVTAYARTMRSSPFMVLLAAYHTYLWRRLGRSDLVTPTFAAGRQDDRFAAAVGPIFNMVPLRTDLKGCRTFNDVLQRTRRTCVEAYANELPFAEVAQLAPEITETFADSAVAVAAFEVLQYPPSDGVVRLGSASAVPLRDRRVSQSVSSAIPDGALWALDITPSGQIVGSLKYNRVTFDDGTIADIIAGFRAALRAACASPEAPLPPV